MFDCAVPVREELVADQVRQPPFEAPQHFLRGLALSPFPLVIQAARGSEGADLPSGPTPHCRADTRALSVCQRPDQMAVEGCRGHRGTEVRSSTRIRLTEDS